MKYSFGYGKKQQEITKNLNRSKLGDEFIFEYEKILKKFTGTNKPCLNQTFVCE